MAFGYRKIWNDLYSFIYRERFCNELETVALGMKLTITAFYCFERPGSAAICGKESITKFQEQVSDGNNFMVLLLHTNLLPRLLAGFWF